MDVSTTENIRVEVFPRKGESKWGEGGGRRSDGNLDVGRPAGLAEELGFWKDKRGKGSGGKRGGELMGRARSTWQSGRNYRAGKRSEEGG